MSDQRGEALADYIEKQLIPERDALKARLDAALLQVRDFRNVVWLAVQDLKAAVELGVTSLRVLNVGKMLEEVLGNTEKPLEGPQKCNYTESGGLCGKALPCPDHFTNEEADQIIKPLGFKRKHDNDTCRCAKVNAGDGGYCPLHD